MPGPLQSISASLPLPPKTSLHLLESPAESLTTRGAIFNPTIGVRILRGYQRMDANLNDARIFVEPSAMYEPGRPFLEALKTEPTSMPFSKYLVLCGDIWQTSHSNYSDMRPLRAFCGSSRRRSWKGMIFDLMQKMLLQSPILAKYCAMTISCR